MKKLKTLVASFTLIVTVAIAAIAGDINTPPCTPGDINTPPCASDQMATNDSTSPGETETPPAAETVVITTIADAAIGALLSVF
jgi:hypothetical protein